MNQNLISKNFSKIILSLFALGSCLNPIEQANVLKISTSSGISHGYLHKNIITWEDIPYAIPPEGDLRWKAPRPLISPEFEITPKDGNGCLQEASIYAGIKGEGIVGQEDCLYLDIKAPANNINRRLPVMFWIHGGGNTSGVKDYYDFSELIREQQVLVVTINYRLGPMGWFTHPAIQGLQNGIDKTSNFGTLDIMEALKWVQNNIENFGGDPSNITIFGESAGGHNVLSLLASPVGKRLFHKAISQSGYTTSFTKEEAIGINQKGIVVNELGSDPVLSSYDSSGYESIKNLFNKDPKKYGEEYQRYLRSIDGKALLEIYEKLSKDTYDRLPLLTRDGIVTHIDGVSAGLASSKEKNNIPVIAGSNKDELSLWLGSNRYFVNASYPFTKLVPIPKIEFKREDLYKLWVKTRSQGWKLRGVDEPLIELEKAGNNSLYAYRFDWDDQSSTLFADFPNLIGAAHGFEISFITGDFKFGPIGRFVYPKGELRDQMKETMMQAWASFAKTGVPNTGKGQEWKKFNSEDRNFMKLDSDKNLSLDKEMLSLKFITENVRVSSVGTLLEKCLLVQETFFNIGDYLEDEFNKWNQNACKQFDMDLERKKIETELIKEFGSATVY
ncbi:carboxylesterase family protein [Gammaproteobacteria bacterium]|nr:carboxylesterase family protein [Gammaproteobacteria bacterium]